MPRTPGEATLWRFPRTHTAVNGQLTTFTHKRECKAKYGQQPLARDPDAPRLL